MEQLGLQAATHGHLEQGFEIGLLRDPNVDDGPFIGQLDIGRLGDRMGTTTGDRQQAGSEEERGGNPKWRVVRAWCSLLHETAEKTCVHVFLQSQELGGKVVTSTSAHAGSGVWVLVPVECMREQGQGPDTHDFMRQPPSGRAVLFESSGRFDDGVLDVLKYVRSPTIDSPTNKKKCWHESGSEASGTAPR